jgi:hypothetical protein
MSVGKKLYHETPAGLCTVVGIRGGQLMEIRRFGKTFGTMEVPGLPEECLSASERRKWATEAAWRAWADAAAVAPRAKKEKKPPATLPEATGGVPPPAVAYRIPAAEIKVGVCVGRLIHYGGRGCDRRWSIAIYKEFQCGGAILEDDLCAKCAAHLAAYAEEPGPRKGWFGRVTEDPLEWIPMLDTAWGQTRLASGKLKWNGEGAEAVAPPSPSIAVSEVETASDQAETAADPEETFWARIMGLPCSKIYLLPSAKDDAWDRRDRAAYDAADPAPRLTLSASPHLWLAVQAESGFIPVCINTDLHILRFYVDGRLLTLTEAGIPVDAPLWRRKSDEDPTLVRV